MVPKHHGEKLTDIPDGTLREILPVVKRLVKATGAVDYNILQNNGRIAHQQVDHVHFHMVSCALNSWSVRLPTNECDQIPKPNASEGLGIGWPTQTDFSKSQLQALCKQITKAMNSNSDTVKRSVMGRSNKF